ncbi:DNA polymerase IV, partial [Streptococcus suis]
MTKRHSLEEATNQAQVRQKEISQLCEEVGRAEKGVRLIGVT